MKRLLELAHIHFDVLQIHEMVLANRKGGEKKVDAYQLDNVLYISITNLKGFSELAEQAKKEAHQLQHTIDELQNFEIEVKFETDKSAT